MSDLIEKIAEVEKHNMALKLGLDALVIDLDEHAEEDAQRILDVIKENAGDLVKQLEWREGLFGGYRSVCGSYEIRIILGRRNRTLRLLFSQFGSGQDMGEFVGENAEYEAKAAAQQHHTARVLSLLNLEVE